MNQKLSQAFFFSSIVILFLTIIFCLMIGPLGISKLSLSSSYFPIFNYRIGRIILAIIAGSSLAVSGTSLQALFRNPLADPHLFGISGGAALGAALSIAFSSNGSWIAPSIGAIIGGLMAFLLIFFYLEKSSTQSLTHCLLVGVLINSLAAAIISFLKTILPPIKTQGIFYWMIGHISPVENSHFLFIIPIWILALSILMNMRGEMEILSFGRIETSILGINVNSVVRRSIIANSLLIGNVVAFTGMIGFLGLMIPHFIRLFIFPDLRFVMPMSALIGAIVLLFFDGLSRLSFFIWQTEIPVGALCAFFLSPLFFLMLTRGFNER